MVHDQGMTTTYRILLMPVSTGDVAVSLCSTTYGDRGEFKGSTYQRGDRVPRPAVQELVERYLELALKWADDAQDVSHPSLPLDG